MKVCNGMEGEFAEFSCFDGCFESHIDDIPTDSEKGWGRVPVTGSWLEDFVQRISGCQPLDPLDLRPVLTTWAMKNVLSAHLYDRNMFGDQSWREIEDVIRATARVYLEYTSWGETSPAAAIAHLMGVKPLTIHNRLRLARERHYLPAPGAGSRTNLRLDPEKGLVSVMTEYNLTADPLPHELPDTVTATDPVNAAAIAATHLLDDYVGVIRVWHRAQSPTDAPLSELQVGKGV